jgi:hypothetical protein
MSSAFKERLPVREQAEAVLGAQPARFKGMTDQEIVLRAFTELQKIAARYIEPDPLATLKITMQQMLSILDRREVVA